MDSKELQALLKMTLTSMIRYETFEIDADDPFTNKTYHALKERAETQIKMLAEALCKTSKQ